MLSSTKFVKKMSLVVLGQSGLSAAHDQHKPDMMSPHMQPRTQAVPNKQRPSLHFGQTLIQLMHSEAEAVQY